ncbi:MAG TPA: cytochrome d ubiquinol oxidase subunit II, partial [Terriglobales bacterium]|nr:cytochrome d ubiquinol oxidase subunit II [Terriglobales bacterium]
NYYVHPSALIVPILVFVSMALMLHSLIAGKWKYAFACSTVYIGGMLVGAAFGLYPNVLPASTDPSYSLTIYNTAAADYGLRVGLIWWCVGMVLALGYFVFIYRMFRGKVRLDAGEEGY